MRCNHYENGFKKHLSGNANLIAYLTKGFRGWQLFGFVKDETEQLGITLGGDTIVPVYGTKESNTCQSDQEDKEQEQIDAGKTSILLFYGTDNYSVMRRVSPEEFESMELTRFIKKPSDLFYNS